MLVKKADILQKMSEIPTTKKGYKGTMKMYTALYNAMNDTTLIECKQDWNLGQLYEAFYKTVKAGYEIGYYSRANSADFEDGRGEIEIKVSANCYDLCMPITKPVRVVFFTDNGCFTISKKMIKEIMSDIESYMEFVKITETGFRLKPTATILGVPNTAMNEVLGF